MGWQEGMMVSLLHDLQGPLQGLLHSSTFPSYAHAL